jgi:diguanylate cyclase (GGDEF)-like protein/PAS domain S-box-containing protein
MFRVLECLAHEHDTSLVVLAGFVSLLASLVTICLVHRARAAQGRYRLVWLALAGIVAGCGIWATHFVAMLAYATSVPVAYDAVLTLLSLAVATAVAFVGILIASHGAARFAPPLGGAVVGAAIAGMHYTGMFALQLPGHLVWSIDLVVASVVLGMVFGAMAMAMAVRTAGTGAAVAAATLLAAAVTSHHFTAMGAVEMALDPQITVKHAALSPSALSLTIASAAVAILGLIVLVTIADDQLARRRQQLVDARQRLIDESEAKLRAQNAQLDAALNNMSQGLCLFDADERVVVFNRHFLEMYRLSPQVVKAGCTLRELLQHRKEVGLLDGDPERYYRQIIEGVRLGRPETWIIRTTEGRFIQTMNQPLPGGGWVTTHEDITARRHAEDQIREQKLQLDIALDNMTQGLLMFDAQARLVLCNRRYSEMYNLPPEIVTPGASLLTLLEWRARTGTFTRDPKQYVGELQAALAAGRPVTLVVDLPDGRIISIVNQPMADGRWVSTHEDITEQRRAEERLQQQKVQLDTALNTMSQGLNMFDANGRLVLCNRRYLDMYRVPTEIAQPGCTIEDLIRARIAAGTFFAVDPDKYAAELREAMQSRAPTSTTMELTDGRIIHVISQPTPDGGGWVVTHEDITERRRAEQERDRSRAFADTIIENVPSTIVVKDFHDLRYVLINRAGEQYFGLPREAMIGKRAVDVFPPEMAAMIEAHDRELLAHAQPQFIDERPVTTPAGEHRIITSTRLPIRDEQGHPKYLLTLVEDRTHRRRAEAQIAHMAHHDALTGVPNRAAFNVCLEATIENAMKEGAPFALMCLDIDRFKEINDVFGHATGDALLCELSRRLQAAVGGAFVARLGGDEFVVIATDGEQPAAAERLAERLLEALNAAFTVDGRTLHAGVSIGIAIYPTDSPDAATLMANANAALYRAKTEGRGGYRFFEAVMDRRLRERRALQHELRLAIERKELGLFYQPQARIGGEVFGFEALVRWHHAQHGAISPGTFIPLAEESGLINTLGEWILREACREAASWRNPLQIAINLSPVQFRHGDLPNLVHSILLETGLSPSRLELEITEGVLIGDFSRAVTILRRLKLLGVRIAMDDFGTGYSSLSYLQSFPFDKIKIDQAFISNLERNPQSATIIRAVIGLARGLDLPVLAEGVETKDQLAFLAKESCDEVQGYLIGRPRPIEHYAALTGDHAAARRAAEAV